MKLNKYLTLIISLLLLTSCTTQTNIEIKGWGEIPQEIITPTTIDEARETLNNDAKIANFFSKELKNACKKNKSNKAIQKAINSLKNNSNIIAIEYSHKSVYIYGKLNNEPVVFLTDSYIREGKNDICDNY